MLLPRALRYFPVCPNSQGASQKIIFIVVQSSLEWDLAMEMRCGVMKRDKARCHLSDGSKGSGMGKKDLYLSRTRWLATVGGPLYSLTQIYRSICSIWPVLSCPAPWLGKYRLQGLYLPVMGLTKSYSAKKSSRCQVLVSYSDPTRSWAGSVPCF